MDRLRRLHRAALGRGFHPGRRAAHLQPQGIPRCGSSSPPGRLSGIPAGGAGPADGSGPLGPLLQCADAVALEPPLLHVRGQHLRRHLLRRVGAGAGGCRIRRSGLVADSADQPGDPADRRPRHPALLRPPGLAGRALSGTRS
ncbi:MAG: hypothetical protein BAJATHORv1_140017 [Candidatus Thorarchaeota archaeon]|nr:MAG: hypothetical protein BAJATHORv1_140017 [Candidatus Thorarchaeota archaeon]